MILEYIWYNIISGSERCLGAVDAAVGSAFPKRPRDSEGRVWDNDDEHIDVNIITTTTDNSNTNTHNIDDYNNDNNGDDDDDDDGNDNNNGYY